MIAYYAHQHGFGHSNSANEFCKIFNEKALVVTSSNFNFDESIEVIQICNEDTKYTDYLISTHNLPRYAHYLPKSDNKILYRNFQILETCLTDDIRFALIDVSVETAIQFRIAGIPYAYNKMLGDRKDLPHQLAYEASEFVYAYYPEIMEESVLNTAQIKTYYLGFISRFKFRTAEKLSSYNKSSSYRILILTGRGGTLLTPKILGSICKRHKNFDFTVIGLGKTLDLPNLNYISFTHNLETLIESHDIIISSCGLNLTAEILSIKNKFIAIAEDRPYKEQITILNSLVRNNLAIELNIIDLNSCIKQLVELPVIENLESYFGRMENFMEIKELIQYL